VREKLAHLFGHKGFVRYFKNTSWLMAEKILRMVVGLFVGIWVARYLGPDKFGLLSYAQSFVGLFAAISTLGLDGIVVRELVKRPEKEYVLIGTAFVLKIFGAFLTLALLAVVVHFTSNDHYTNLLVFIIASATIFQSFNVVDLYFQSKVLSRYVVYANIVSLFASSIVKVLLILNEAPLIAFAWVVLFDSFVLACGFVYFFARHSTFNIQHLKFKGETAVSLLKDSWPLILSGVAISTYMKIDQVMIQEMLGSKEVGYYSVAVKFSEVWLFIAVSITNSLFPAIINAKKESYEKYENRVLNLYRLLVLISIFISFFVYLIADKLVLYMYGEKYTPSIALLQMYVWSILFVFLNNASWKWYISENLQNIANFRLFLGAAVNIVLNLIWIKYYGLIGAVYATLVSYAIATYFGNLLSRKTMPNFKLQTIALITCLNIKGVRL